ncbi:MAG: hypothetical protein K2M78_15300 [Lachnospiraceae bacterium]|nr:hypothetical protein [Lachnospiraceae bacterium]
MTEEMKIQKITKKYNNFFQTSSADIASTMKGSRFFYLLDEISGEFSSYIKFDTAEELEQIILHEMVDDLNFALEVGLENLNEEINDKNFSYTDCKFGNTINHLANSIEAIHTELNKWDSKLQNSLDGISTFITTYKNEDENQM